MSELSSKQANEAKNLPMMNLGVELPEFDKTKYPHGGYAKLRDFGWWIWESKTKCKPDSYSRLIRFEDMPSSSSLSCAIKVDELEHPGVGEGFMYDQSMGPELYICGVKNGEFRFGIVTEEYDDYNFYLEDGLFAFGLSEEDYHYIGEDIDIFFKEIGKGYVQKQAEKIIEKDGYTPEDFLELALFRPNVVKILMSILALGLPDSPKIVYGAELSLSELRTIERWLINAVVLLRKDCDDILNEKEKKELVDNIFSLCSEIGMQTILQNFSYALGILLLNTDPKELLSVNPPQTLSQFCARMLNPKELGVVYNPFSALGGIVQSLPYNEVRGEEADANLWLESMGYEYAVDYAEPCYKSGVDNKDPLSSLRNPTCEHQYIASVLPLTLDDKEKAEIFNLMLDCLASDGTLVCVLPISFTTGSAFKSPRQRLLEGNYAIDIVSLPSLYEPYSSVGLCLIRVHCVEQEYQRQLTLVDGKEFVKNDRFSHKQLLIESLMEAINEKTNVTTLLPHELVQDTILKPERYLALRDLPQLSKGYQYLPLKQLVSVLSEGDETGAAILLSTVGNLLKHCDMNEIPVTVPRNAIAVKVDGSVVTKDYLLHELQADYVQQQFKAFANGATLKRISRKDLMNIQIAVPPIDEQHKVMEASFKTGLEQAKQLLEKEFERYRKDIRMKKHALGQDVFKLIGAWKSLMYIREENGGQIIDTMDDGEENAAEIMRRISYHIEAIRKQVDEFTLADETQSRDTFVLYDFLSDYISKYGSSGFVFDKLECVRELQSATVDFSKKALKLVLDNLVFNAKVHGFDGLSRQSTDNHIRLVIGVEEDVLTVVVANNGRPMNETIRGRMFEDANTSARGIDGHSGSGCHQCKLLMTRNGGDIVLLSPENGGFNVIFKLIFKQFNTEEQ